MKLHRFKFRKGTMTAFEYEQWTKWLMTQYGAFWVQWPDDERPFLFGAQ
jgi:hypothetical protein